MESGNEPNTAASSDLQQIERVFLKLALIQTDEDLQKFLERFLAPLVIKLNSTDEQVHQKLIELFTHLNKRVIDRPNISIPLSQLFHRFQQDNLPNRVINFLLIYIRMGLSRCTPAKKSEIFPVIAQSLKGKASNIQGNLLQFLVPMLANVQFIGVSDSGYTQLPFAWESFEDIKSHLIEYLYYYLILPYNIERYGTASPPGFCTKAMNSLKANSNTLPVGDALEQVKLSILQFLTTECFKQHSDTFLLLVAASGDPRVKVKEKAESILKKVPLPDCLGSPDVIRGLFALFLGGPMYSHSRPKGAKRAKITPAEEEAKPADYLIRLRIFPFLIKSEIAHDVFPECIKIIFEALFGEVTNMRLREYSLQFAHQLCVKTTDKKIGYMAPLLQNALEKLITQSDDLKLLIPGYQSLGLLAKRRPQAFKDKIQFFQSMFDSLTAAERDLGLAIYECISLMTDAFKSGNEEVQTSLEALFPSMMETESSLARLATVSCCHRIFPPAHILSRYLMLIAAGDARGDVRDEAIRGLSLEGKKSDSLPNFDSLVSFLVDKCNKRVSSAKFESSVGELPFKPVVLVKMLQFLDQLICQLSGAHLELVGRRQLQKQKEFFSSHSNEVLLKYLSLIKLGLKPAANSALHEVSLKSLKDILHCVPGLASAVTFKSLDSFIGSGRDTIRRLAAELTGLIMRESSPQDINIVLKLLLGSINDNARLEQVDGSIQCLGYVIGFCREEHFPELDKECVNRALELMMSSVRHESLMIVRTSLETLSIVLAHQQQVDKVNVKPIDLFDTVSAILKSSKTDIPSKESGFLLLGLLSVCHRDEAFLKNVCGCLIGQHGLQGADLHLGIGEALSFCVVGNRSKAFQLLPFLHDSISYAQTADSLDVLILENILDRIFTILSDEYVIKKGYSVPLWLLSLLQLVIVPFNLSVEMEKIHTSLLSVLLNTANSVSQEAASIGLYVAFSVSSEDTKSSQLAALQKYMGTQSIDYIKKKKKSDSSATEKDEESKESEDAKTLELSLPKAASTTYKEIFNLSRVLKDPSFTYPLVNLGHLFTLSTLNKGKVLDLSGTKDRCIAHLEPELPNIIPKIFSFLHDPHLDLQRIMNNIWDSLVQEDRKVVEQYFRPILTELKTLLGFNSWSVRMGSCLCLKDILTSQPFDAFVDDLPELWKLVLRNLDDFKEAVRVAAAIACTSLSKITVKICTSSSKKEMAEKNIGTLLPLVLDYAVNSAVKEVQSICLATLVSITKYAGQLVKPVIPELIVTLLNALSDLEPAELSRLSVMIEQDQLSQEKMESIRLDLSRSSPMMDTIRSCIQYVDTQVLEQLAPKLVDLTKSSIALNTKVGCSKVAVFLAIQCKHELAPYSQKLISAFLSKMNDKSLSVKKEFASSISQLVKVAKESTFEKLVLKITKLYFSGDTDHQLNACLILQSISQNCPDSTNNFKSNLIPLVFFALHDKVTSDETPQQEDSAKFVNNALWEEIWDSLAPNKERALILYFDELVEILLQQLDAQVWERREQALKSIIDLAKKIAKELSITHADDLLAGLMKYLPGRVWDGKIQLPIAIEVVCVNCSEKIKANGLKKAPQISQILEILLKEAARTGPLQPGLIQSIASIIEEYKSEMYPDYFKLAYSILDKQNKEETSGEKEGSVKHDELTVVIFRGFAKVFPNFDQKGFLQEYFTFAGRLLNQSPWKIHLSVLESVGKVCEKLTPDENPGLIVESISLLLKPTIISSGNKTHSRVRGESLNVLLKILNLIDNCKLIDSVLTSEMKNLLCQQTQMILTSEQQSLLGRIMFFFDRTLKETDQIEDMEGNENFK